MDDLCVNRDLGGYLMIIFARTDPLTLLLRLPNASAPT
jgi:hypothetical protein